MEVKIHKKIKQHYVWRQYLRAWTKGNDFVWTLFKNQKRIAFTDLIKVGFEKNLYTIEKLNMKEYEFSVKFIKYKIKSEELQTEHLFFPELIKMYIEIKDVISKYLQSKTKVIDIIKEINKQTNISIDSNEIINSNTDNSIMNKLIIRHQLSNALDLSLLKSFKSNIINYFEAKKCLINSIEKGDIKKLNDEIIYFNDIETTELLNKKDYIKLFSSFFPKDYNFVIEFLNKNILKYINENGNKIFNEMDVISHNLGEEYQSDFEHVGIKFLEELKNENLKIFENQEELKNFYIYLSIQYTRTKNIKNNIIKSITTPKTETDKPFIKRIEEEKLNIENMWKFLQYSFAFDLVSILNSNKKNKIYLLKSETTHFLTCDQPIINLEKNELELYYPISPDKAIIITSKEKYKKQIEVISDKEIDKFNQFMVDNCEDQVYSDNENLLKNISLK